MGISDHKPICLRLGGVIVLSRFPFKFNNSWLEEDEFCCLMKNTWFSLSDSEGDSSMTNRVQKLKSLKNVVVEWEKRKTLISKHELLEIERVLERIYSSNSHCFYLEEERFLLLQLEAKKITYLKNEE